MLRIAACSYEGSIFGWNVPVAESRDGSTSLLVETHFDYGFHASHGSLKSVAISKSGKYMATAGMNERISVYSLEDNQEMGELSGHSGAITYLEFFEDSFLISASEDNTMYIWRCYDWENIHILGGHKDAVSSFSIHPTGKIAMSVSKDLTLHIWNLVQGRSSFRRKILPSPEIVLWHPTGESYLVSSANNIKLFGVADNAVIVDHTVRSRINHVTFLQTSDTEFSILYICDNQTLNILTMEGSLLRSLALHALGLGRLKSLTATYDAVERTNYVSFITSMGSLLVINGAQLLQLVLAKDLTQTLSEDSKEAAQDKLQLIKDTITPATNVPAVIGANKNANTAADELLFASVLIAHHQLPSEPRLTAVAGYIRRDNSAAAPAIEDSPAEVTATLEDAGNKRKEKKKEKKRSAVDEEPAEEVEPKKQKKSVDFSDAAMEVPLTNNKLQKKDKKKQKQQQKL